MRKIFEYPLKTIDHQTIDVNNPAILLSVIEQKNQIKMYAIADDIGYKIHVEVRIIGTGNPIEEDIELFKFLGTVKLSGVLVFHVFARHYKDFTIIEEKKGEDIPVLRIDEFVNFDERSQIMVA